MFLRGVQVRGRRLPGFGPERQVVVGSKDLVFLPLATLNDSRPQPADEDEPTTQPALAHTTEPTTLPAASDPPAPALPTPHPRIIICLPKRLMKGPPVDRRDESDEHDGSEDEATRLTHDVSCVPDYPVRSTRSGLMHKWWSRHAHFR